MSKIVDNLIPNAPSDLCFNYKEFTKESFSVDQFLQDHRNKANLETLRDDLGVYLKALRSAMIELINKDYVDFVNLSSNLIGLDKAINGIQIPLGQLKEELLLVQHNIEDAMAEVMNQLEQHKKIRERKRSLNSLSRVHTSIKKLSSLFASSEQILDPLVLERAAAEYNQMQFHMSRCKDDLSASDKKNCEELGQHLYKCLDNQFIECQSGKGESHQQLPRILSVYLTLGRSLEAESLYRKAKVSPVMNTLISEEALASNPRGLTGLYNTLISFIDEDMKALLQYTQHTDKPPVIKGFNFLIRSYWPEVEERLGLHLKSIYAPGNPDLFFQCYSDTIQFLSNLESRCDTPDAVKALHQHPQYSKFLHRWSLPVYFQIRFKDIAGTFESALNRQELTNNEKSEWRLVATKTAWECLQRCWADKVFIAQLTHRFWKLSLQILARYYTWSAGLLESKSDDGKSDVQFWVCLYSDLNTLANKLEQFYKLASSRFGPKVSTRTQDLLYRSLEESKQQLLSQLDAVSTKLVRIVCVDSITALRQVSEVPRLFRRTNRDVPTKCLPYVTAMLTPPTEFYTSHRSHPNTSQWLQSIFSNITRQYFTALCDVLTSVQKTEESLWRLKKSRDRSAAARNTPNERGSGGGGDDDKIRLQLYLDVKSYCQGVEELGVRKENVDQLSDLLTLVESSQAKNGHKT